MLLTGVLYIAQLFFCFILYTDTRDSKFELGTFYRNATLSGLQSERYNIHCKMSTYLFALKLKMCFLCWLHFLVVENMQSKLSYHRVIFVVRAQQKNDVFMTSN